MKTSQYWVNRVLGYLQFGWRLFVWDAYKCLLMTRVKALVNKQGKTDLSIIPGSLTSQLQPADASWNNLYRESFKAKYADWMATGKKTYTPAGTMRAPSKALCLQWVKEVWESLSADLIKRSFRACGISVNMNSKEDNQVHSLELGGVHLKKTAELQLRWKEIKENEVVDEDETEWVKVHACCCAVEFINHLFKLQNILLAHFVYTYCQHIRLSE